MAQIMLKGNAIETVGTLPKVGSMAPDFNLTKSDLSDIRLAGFAGKNLILNIFPSLDTAVCAASVRWFNAEASNLPDTIILCISADLPFAHKRFCEVEGLDKVIPLSSFRAAEFGRDYGVAITTGPLTGLLSRAIVIIDRTGKVLYTEQVPEITQEPDYNAALTALK